MSAENASTPVKSTPVELTAREMTILVQALTCLKSGDLQVDYNKLAERGSFAHAGSAKASWNAIRRKLEKMAEDANGEDTPKMTKRKKTSNDGEDVTTPSPKKKKTAATGKKGDKAAKVEPEDEEDY